MLLTEADHARRTDDDFKQQKNKLHHKGESPLLKLPIGMVSQFPLDYMHFVCLGVIKILVQYWLGETPYSAKLPSHVKASISQKMEELQAYAPREFCRKPRTLQEVKHWKATELRNFIVYFGPVVLLDARRDFYRLVMKLDVAISILADPVFCSTHIDLAENLLYQFV